MDIKDICYDDSGSTVLNSIVHSSMMKSDNAVLVYRHKKKDRESPGKRYTKNKSISEDDSFRETSIKDTTDDSLEGSPLKLQQFHVDYHLVQNNVAALTGLEPHYKIQGNPLDVTQARYLLSFKPKEYPNVPIWVYCNGSDPEGIVLLGSYSEHSNQGDAVIIHTYKITSKGPYNNKEQFPKVSSITQKYFTNSPKVRTRCFAEYDVFESSATSAARDDASILQQHGGILKIKLEWEKAVGLLQNPPLDAKTTVEVSISEGDPRSAAYTMFTELITLQGFAHGLKDGCVEWAVQNEDKPIIQKLRKMLEDLKQGDYGKVVAEEEEETQTPLKSLRFGRKDLDFTGQLWNIFKDCSCYRDLVEGLSLVFSYLHNGQIQPMVHKSNLSPLAQLVRDSYYGKMILPTLEGLLPLQMLVEIGTEKLKRDYINTFIGRDLVTGSHLEYFLKPGDSYEDTVNRLSKLHSALEVAVMLEQYLNLPSTTLSMSARQALKYYEKNGFEEGHVFSVPVQTNCIADKIENYQASLWKIELYGNVDDHEVCTSAILTTRPLYSHLNKDTSLSKDLEEASLHYYLTTESENIIVL